MKMTQIFTAEDIVIDNIEVQVGITRHKGSKIGYKITGASKALDEVKAKMNGKTLDIAKPESQETQEISHSFGNTNVRIFNSGGGKQVNRSLGHVDTLSFSDEHDDEETKITLVVPQGMKVFYKDEDGKLTEF